MAFVVFEGGEGTGKSSQLNLLWERFNRTGIPCLKTREPGGTPLAENIRALFKSIPQHGDTPVPKTELMLVMAARAQHFEKIIAPSQDRKEWMLCDRFVDSSYVYQSIVGGVSKTYVDTVAQGILNTFIPDLTFVFHLNPKIAQERMRMCPTRERADRMDTWDASLHSQINSGFVRLVHENWTFPCGKTPVRVLIDGSATLEAVSLEVARNMQSHFGISL